jgi:TIR domain
MNASTRVKTIRSLTDELEQEEFRMAWLTLDQFGASGGDSILERLGNSSDDALAAMAAHYGLSTRAEEATTVWDHDMFRLFVSHHHTIRAQAAKLKGVLARRGVSAFVARDDIEPTAEWQAEIERALRTCQALVALLTKEFHPSNWTDQEVGAAFGRGVLILPVALGVNPYGFIGKYQALGRALMPPEEVAEKVVEVLLSHPQTKPLMAEPLVRAMETSWSFADSKRLLALVESYGELPPPLWQRLVSAAGSNDQIRLANGVAPRLQVLAEEATRRTTG